MVYRQVPGMWWVLVAGGKPAAGLGDLRLGAGRDGADQGKVGAMGERRRGRVEGAGRRGEVARSAGRLLAWSVILVGVFVGVGLLVKAWPGAGELEALRPFIEGRTALRTRLAKIGTLFTQVPVAAGLTPLGILAAAWLWRRWREPLFLLVAVAGQSLIYLVVSFSVRRPRPPVVELVDEPFTWSWTSGHMSAAVTIYGGLAILAARRWPHPAVRNFAYAAAVLIVLSVGLSRTYLTLHYPSDIAGGILLGLLWLRAAVHNVLSVPGGRRDPL